MEGEEEEEEGVRARPRGLPVSCLHRAARSFRSEQLRLKSTSKNGFGTPGLGTFDSEEGTGNWNLQIELYA